MTEVYYIIQYPICDKTKSYLFEELSELNSSFNNLLYAVFFIVFSEIIWIMYKDKELLGCTTIDYYRGFFEDRDKIYLLRSKLG